MSTSERTREHLLEVYRRKAKHYDLISQLSPVPGYPQHAQRLRAIRALGLRAGDLVVDLACGTGLNFPLLEQAIGPDGRIVGVDLTDAMLARARSRVAAGGWGNVGLVQADAADYVFPDGVDAILSTYALTQVPECGRVVAQGAAALSRGRRWVVLDLKLPDATPGWVSRFGIAAVGTSASLDEWIDRRPWETIRSAMQDSLSDASWTELCFGTAFLAVGSGRGDVRVQDTRHPRKVPRGVDVDASMGWNDDVIDTFRTSKGTENYWGPKLIVLHSIGARSGEIHLNPVVGFRTDGGWRVVASKGGAPENPAWYHNLRVNPTFEIEALVDGDVVTVPVTATEITGDEWRDAYDAIAAEEPQFGGYLEKTDRRIPVFQLTPVAG